MQVPQKPLYGAVEGFYGDICDIRALWRFNIGAYALFIMEGGETYAEASEGCKTDFENAEARLCGDWPEQGDDADGEACADPAFSDPAAYSHQQLQCERFAALV